MKLKILMVLLCLSFVVGCGSNDTSTSPDESEPNSPVATPASPVATPTPEG